MKYIKFLLSFFYSEERRSSKYQLGIDFERFPPRPLNTSEFDSEFLVVKLRGPGGIYPFILMAKKLWKAKDARGVPEPLHEVWKSLLSAKDGLREIRKNLTSITKTKRGKTLLVIALSIVSPIIIPVIFVYVVIFFTKLYRKTPTFRGYFIPLFADENRVMVNKSKSKDGDLEVIVAHEHIHMLQHKSGEIFRKELRCDELLLCDEWRNDKYLLYLLERNELEARLHEIVISHYRKNKVLPITLNEFVELLAGSSQFGWLVIKTMQLNPSELGKSLIKRYEERSKDIAQHIELILMVIEDDDLRQRFIIEVLSVMYGNLIKYYGDEELSRNFLSNICRPNLYDKLYSQ